MAATHPDTYDVEPPLIEHPGRRLTEDEFVAWCHPFERVRAEWVDGEVIVMSPVNLGHLRLSGFLYRIMAGFAESHQLGEVNGPEFASRFRVGPRIMRRLPDVWFVRTDRLHLLKPTYLDGPPDLALEIVSPDSVDRDYREKSRDYQAAGVREYWIVDPISENLEVSRLDAQTGQFVRIPEAEGRVASEVLPGFFLRPQWVWSDPLPRVAGVLRELGV
jgi:Uma2 family endonuclease